MATLDRASARACWPWRRARARACVSAPSFRAAALLALWLAGGQPARGLAQRAPEVSDPQPAGGAAGTLAAERPADGASEQATAHVLDAASAPARAERAERAAALFERGVELYGEGNLEASLVQFERAYALLPEPRLLYNLAQIEAERHRYVAAIGLYERYLRDAGQAAPEAQRRESLAQLDKLGARVATLWVESDAPGAKLYVNDELAGTIPLEQPLPIDAGVCRVRLELAGYAPASTTLKVAGGDQARVSLALERVGPAVSEPRLGDARVSYRPLWIASSITLALGVVTLSTGWVARRADQALDQALDRYPVRADELARERARLRTYAALTDGFGAASLVALGASLYYLIVPPRVRSERSVAGSLDIAPSARGLALRGTF
jgi:tetratricopeptide (TPR) repeat protein